MPRTIKQPQPKPIAPGEMAYRPITVRKSGEEIKPADGIPVILATEAPVRVYDKVHRKVVNEVLLMSGAELPKQVAMLDDHDDKTKSTIGSLRELSVEGDELHGVSYFSSKRSAQEIRQDIIDGHLTDMSVGAERLEETFIDSGKEEVVSGRRFKGPARIVTRWRPFHGAVVTRGADERSVFAPAMRAYFDPDTFYEDEMNATFREHLESLGMPKEHSDEQAIEWAKDNIARKAEPKEEKPTPAPVPAPGDDETKRQAIADEAAKTERKRVADIRKSVRAAGLDEKFENDLVERGVTVDRAAKEIIDELSKRNQPHGAGDIRGVGSEHESFRKAVLDGFSQRIGAPVEKPTPGCDEFRRMRFLDLAKRCMDREGVETRRMDDRDVIARAFSLTHTMRASDGQAYHTTGNFANLFLDAQNKTLLRGFENTPSTYQIWVNIAPSVPDFKTINRIRLGEVGNQPMVAENGDYQDMSLSDAKESYRVEKHGSIVSLTWEAMKNDDLNAFSRLVQLQGSAMKRTINKSVYQVLFDNPTLSDGIALFHASSHGANLDTLDLSATNLNTAFQVMMTQTGINSDVILGLTPAYLMVSAADSATAEQIMGSYADPAAGGSAAGNSNTLNLYGPGGQRRLTLIVEPLIDGNDPDSYYLAASSMTCDTIEVTHLQGEEMPVFEQDTAFIQDAVKFKVRQTWGVAAIDYRGLYKSAGNG